MVAKKIFSKAQIDDIISRYAREESLKAIGRVYGVGQSVITRILKENGVTIRTTVFQRAFTEEQEKAIVKSYKDGKSALDIANELGTAHRTVARVLKEEGFNLEQIRNERRKRLSKEQKGEIATKYRNGGSQVDLAKVYGVSPPTIVAALLEQKVELRTMSEAMGGLSSIQKEEIRRLYENGLNTVEISGIFGVGDSTIGKYLDEMGVTRRCSSEVYGGFSEEQEEEVLEKYFSGMTSVEIARAYGKDYKSVLRLVEKRGLQKRTAGESRRLKTERDLDIDEICERYRRGESSISIGVDCKLTYATIIRILEDNGVEIRDRGTLGDSIAHALNQTGNFTAARETEYYIYTIMGHKGLLKPGITFDDATRKKSSGGYYAEKVLSVYWGSRIEAYFFEQAVLRETSEYWFAPKELLNAGWQGCYELRKMDPAQLERIVMFYKEEIEELGMWRFAAEYVQMSEEQRHECMRRVSQS